MIKDNTTERSQPTIAYPSDRLWFDPRVIVANTYQVFVDVVIPSNTSTQILKPNINRVMFGFATTATASTLNISPWPDVDTVAFFSLSPSTNQKMFTLFDFGPLITFGWYGFSGIGVTARMIEILRK